MTEFVLGFLWVFGFAAGALLLVVGALCVASFGDSQAHKSVKRWKR